jgi:hypothetical protein
MPLAATVDGQVLRGRQWQRTDDRAFLRVVLTESVAGTQWKLWGLYEAS